MPLPQPSDEKFSLPITNRSANEITFYLEPWGEFYPMAPHATFTLRATVPIANALSLELGTRSITVWSSVSVQLFDGNNELGAGTWTRTTPPTEGMDVIKHLFSHVDEESKQ